MAVPIGTDEIKVAEKASTKSARIDFEVAGSQDLVARYKMVNQFQQQSSTQIWVVCFSLLLLFSCLPGRSFAQNEQQAEKPPANDPAPKPLQNILNRFLGKDTAPPVDELAKDEPVDPNVPFSKDEQSILENARTRESLGQYQQVLTIYQSLLDSELGAMLQTDDRGPVMLRWEIVERLSALPDAVLDIYQQKYSGLSQSMLDDAYQNANIELIREVANRFFLTPAGLSAANRLASWHFDRGEIALAALWYERLLRYESPQSQDPVWQHRAREVLLLAGFSEENLKYLPSAKVLSETYPNLERRLPDQYWADPESAWKNVTNFFNPPLTEWLLPGGRSHRAGRSAVKDPFLLARWKQSTAENPQIIEQLKEIRDYLGLSQMSAIPAMQPISIGNRIAYRGLDGIVVIQAETGKQLWRSQDEFSPARLLNDQRHGKTPQPEVVNLNIGALQAPVAMATSIAQGRFNPSVLINFLYRDHVHNLITSDGKRLFAIEDNAVLPKQLVSNYYNRNSLSDIDPYHRDWKSARLTAYDLDSGKQIWSVGGPQVDAEGLLPADREIDLSETFFMGPPLVDQEELYILGERDNAIRLYCLDAATGALQSTTLIGLTDSAIDRDLARRWWPAQLSMSQGVLVCQTHVGLLVGVERETKQIVWVSRYTDIVSQDDQNRGRRRIRETVTSPGGLNDRWFPTPPLIIGQTILHAPSEVRHLAAYQLSTGEQLWKNEDMSNAIYLAGTTDEDALVVTKTGLSSYHLQTGKKSGEYLYSESLPSSSQDPTLPSGRPVLSEDKLYLPMGGDQLWVFDLEKKQFVVQMHLGDKDLSLGNLIMSQGRLISASTDEVAMFSPKEQLQESIVARLAADPNDLQARTDQVEMLLLDGKYEKTYQQLHLLKQSGWSNEEQLIIRSLMRKALVGLIQNHPQDSRGWIEELAQVVDSPEDEQVYLRFLSELQIQERDYASAFKTLTQLTNQRNSDLIQVRGQLNLFVDQDVWLSSQLHRLWRASSGEVSSQISSTIQDATEQALDEGIASALWRVVILYGFHPDTEPAYFELIERALDQKNYSQVDRILCLLEQFQDPALRATALAQRVGLLQKYGLPHDAKQVADELKQFDADLVLIDGTTIEEQLEEISIKGSSVPEGTDSSWSSFEYEAHHMGMSRWNHRAGNVNLASGEIAYWDDHRLEYNQSQNRLRIMNASNNEVVWTITLLTQPGMSRERILPIRIEGHVMVLYHGGLVQAYSVPDQELLWTSSLTQGVGFDSHITRAAKVNLPNLYTADKALSRVRINQASNKYGPLVLTDATSVYALGRKELTAFDLFTGQIRWVRRDIPVGAILHGNQEHLCLITPNISESMILNARDGKLVPVPGWDPHEESGSSSKSPISSDSIAMSGLTSIRVMPALAQQGNVPFGNIQVGNRTPDNYMLVGTEITRNKEVWKHDIRKEDYVGVIDEDHLIVVSPSDRVQLLHARTGEKLLDVVVDGLEVGKSKELFAFIDDSQLFLTVNQSTTQYSYLSLSNQRVNGKVTSLDLNTGELMWLQDVEKMNLVLENIKDMPFLMFASAKHEREEKLYIGKFNLMLVDKKTGKALFDDSVLMQNQVQRITWSEQEHWVNLHAYNIVYSIQPKPSSTAAKATAP